MYALSHYAAGIAVVHLAWAFFYLCGTLVWTPRLAGAPTQRVPGAPGAMLEIVVVTATGMAVAGSATFVLGMAGLLYPLTAVGFVLAILAAFFLLGDSPFRGSFWTVRLNLIRVAVTPAMLAVYACTLIMAIPAILPEQGYDALFYHLVYALDWSNAHRIYVDPWVRFPYYAHNWTVFDTWLFELGLGSYVDFLGWLGGALAVLATYGLVDALADRFGRQSRFVGQLAAVLAALALLLTAAFERWVDTGMVDAVIGFFFIASVASTVMAIATKERRWAFYTLLCFSFLVGTKGSFLAFIPPALVATWISFRATRFPLRSSYVACAVALALCLPWYAKNFVETGDPVAPYLNLTLHRTDSKWSQEDMQGVMSDVRVDQSPLFLLALPADIILHADSREYREPGLTLLVTLIFLPGIILVYGLRRGRAVFVRPWFVFAALLFYAITYWLVTSHLGRYALLFYPALAAFVALVALRFGGGSTMRRFAVLAVLGIVALPTPAGATFLSFLWQYNTAVDQTYVDPQPYLVAHMPDYREEEHISGALTKAAIADPRVYVVGDAELPYYFKLHGVSQIGDWFGPERYSDLVRAIDTGTAPAFLKGLHINALLFSPHPLFPPARFAQLETQLKRAGYHEERFPGQPATMFFGPGIQP
jgi:MFS family permease